MMNFRGIRMVAGMTLKSGLRDRLYLAMLLAVALAVVFAVYFGMLAYADPIKALLDAGQSAILVCGLVTIVFFASSDWNRERDGVLPVLLGFCGRSDYVVGKWLGYGLLIGLLVMAGGLLLAACTFLYDRPGWGLLQSLVGMAMELNIMVALCVLMSVLLRSTALVGLATFTGYVLGHTVSETVRAGEHAVAAGADAFSWQPLSGSLFSWLLPDLELLNMRLTAAHGLVWPLGDFFMAILYGFSWSLVLVGLAAWAFYRRDL